MASMHVVLAGPRTSAVVGAECLVLAGDGILAGVERGKLSAVGRDVASGDPWDPLLNRMTVAMVPTAPRTVPVGGDVVVERPDVTPPSPEGTAHTREPDPGVRGAGCFS